MLRQTFCTAPDDLDDPSGAGNQEPASRISRMYPMKENAMKGIAAYILGVPILVIVLLYMMDIF